MDQRTTVKDALQAKAACNMIICGTIQDVRHQGEYLTLAINDGSTVTPIQARLTRAQVGDDSGISRGSTIQLHGQMKPLRSSCLDHYNHPAFEIESFSILGRSDPNSYLISLVHPSPEFLHKNPHLRVRTPQHALVARFRSTVISALSRFFDSHPDGPFYQVHLPLLTWTDCEGSAEVFATPTQCSKQEGSEMKDTYFDARRYLNVSAVFHAEAFVQGLDRIWTLSPCWRAERTDSPRHLAEFWMLEVAVNYIDSLEPLYQLLEETIRSIITLLQDSPAGHEILAQSATRSKNLKQRWNKLLTQNWPRITFADATKLLEPARAAKGSQLPTKSSPHDVTPDEEKYLCEHFDSPVFLTHFPSQIRLFQAAQSAKDIAEIPPGTGFPSSQTTESFDLLLPGIGEVCSGGLREHRLDVLIDTMRKKRFLQGQREGPVPERNAPADAEPYPYLHPGEDLKSVEWFADLRRWGTSPHGGFGVGFERLLQYLTGEDTVKEVISFPRYFRVCGC
ncbi:class II aaRS and biotin synthetase [Aspergillus affinis]|uniref:class II aaRS and biotin synthetase n=1 Tax=Aspergillus affinis TaxID=1070780 RepID=UPI0022FEA207|nr:class II aaRS and biotin synthetase [Aspergillus affinis]KAI9043142.1 class II aaRS and biotin synthetase [Aspergillus affinis]